MADTIKSALFVDYDSFQRSLKDADSDIADSLALTAANWVAAIEDGSLVSPALEESVRRRSLVRRCYADPKTLGDHRAALIAAGFEVIDCPPLDGRERNAADIHMVLDTMDALEHPTGYDEFMLLSADADLTPVLLRLRAHDRTTVIFANEVTGANYKAIADGMIESDRFLAVLSGEEPEQAEPEPEAPAAPKAKGDRNAIEALARKIHGATNVPMLSPRTFADLFRLLAQEIAEEGYHFQNTAENLTKRLNDAGRNVTRRQVLFVVKGLALKGHVFSTTDTPEKLAEVFREQVLYLAGNSDLSLDDEETALLPFWIVGQAPRAAAKPAATPAKPLSERPARKTPTRRRTARTAAKPKAEAEPEKPEAEAEKPAEAIEDTPEKPTRQEKPRAASKPVLERLAEIKATTASRIAARTKSAAKAGRAEDDKPATGAKKRATTKAKRKAGKSAKQDAPDAPKSAEAESGDKDALETSILAAIAEAVDVLVEDDDAREPRGTQAARPEEFEDADIDAQDADGGDADFTDELVAEADQPEEAETPVAEADVEPREDDPDSDDIGDEIQRIIASYSRARQQG
ncbi:NYN domain-containing protein [Bauldia sp.]|uniref:NYN domain-containing protein n=1 Tax=Bauldia sp. TaxID=2575872 RepID=UPI003BA995B4